MDVSFAPMNDRLSLLLFILFKVAFDIIAINKIHNKDIQNTYTGQITNINNSIYTFWTSIEYNYSRVSKLQYNVAYVKNKSMVIYIKYLI